MSQNQLTPWLSQQPTAPSTLSQVRAPPVLDELLELDDVLLLVDEVLLALLDEVLLDEGAPPAPPAPLVDDDEEEALDPAEHWLAQLDCKQVWSPMKTGSALQLAVTTCWPRQARQGMSSAQSRAAEQQRPWRQVLQTGSSSSMPQLRGPASTAWPSVPVEAVDPVVADPP